jgi:rod shape-determining protein MreC
LKIQPVRNIFLFVRRYFNFLFFLVLQVFSIYLIVHYSRYHNAMFSSASNQVTGKINEQYNRVEYYFQLKKTNDSLISANTKLYNKLKADFNLPDSISKFVIDTIKVDSIEQYRRYEYIPAKVVANSVSAQNNFIVLAKGKAQGLKEGMGVIDISNGVVGVITEVSDDYAVVMSLLHKSSTLNGKLLKTGETGTVSWDGKVPNNLSLSGITKGAKVAKGDTIISSGFSVSLPKGLLMGTVEAVLAEKSSNNVLIKLKSAANFYNLEHVYVIKNAQQQAIEQILDKAKKEIQ